MSRCEKKKHRSVQPLVSVIVANYNHGKFLHECIESILGQTFEQLEIIIVDDFSCDRSRDIIVEYSSKFPDIIHGVFLNRNQGPAVARHSGILRSRGKYITTLDADDIFVNNRKLEKEMNLVLDYRQRQVDIVSFSRTINLSSDLEKVKHKRTAKILEGYIAGAILSRRCMVPRDFIFPKTAYLKVGGFRTELKIYEDWDLKIRLARELPYYYTGEAGTGYRQNRGGLSRSKFFYLISNQVTVFLWNYDAKRDGIVIAAGFLIFVVSSLLRKARQIVKQKIKVFFQRFFRA